MLQLSESERTVLGKLQAKLGKHQRSNTIKWRYYDGELEDKNLGIAVPQSHDNIKAVVGWSEIVVDALAERLEWTGWRSTQTGEELEALERVFAQNQLGIEVSKAILDALVTGVGFLEVSHGGLGEPEVLVHAVSSRNATYVWDSRRNRAAAGLVVERGDDGTTFKTLYLPDSTVSLVVPADSSQPVTVERSDHGLGRCQLVVMPNRSRAGAFVGASELSKAIRYYVDHGVRTIMGMEYNREFYTTPQRYLLNVTMEQMGLDEDELDRQKVLELGWKVAQNKALIVPPGEDYETGEKTASPTAGQFQAASPQPYIDQLRALSQLVAAQSGVPVTYLGFVSDNPASAEAIRAMESRLVKKAELRQALFGQVLRNDLAWVCLGLVQGSRPAPESVASLSATWRDASTPTLAATMDAAVKAVSAGIAPAHSQVVWDMLGFTREQQAVMKRDLAAERVSSRAELLASAVPDAEQAVSTRSVADSSFDEFVQGSDSSGL